MNDLLNCINFVSFSCPDIKTLDSRLTKLQSGNKMRSFKPLKIKIKLFFNTDIDTNTAAISKNTKAIDTAKTGNSTLILYNTEILYYQGLCNRFFRF